MISSRSAVVTLPEDKQILITREFDAPKDLVYRAYTEPELVRRWWHANRGEMKVCDIDLRVGGQWRYAMDAPSFGEVAFHGEYKEIVPNERLVSTDAYTAAWEPSAKPFMTVILTFEDLGGGRTRYTARARHWTEADREAHEKMGFHEGWGKCADQLAALAAKL